jgi:hypothetical protein
MDEQLCELLQKKLLRNEIEVFVHTKTGWILKWYGATLTINGKKCPWICRCDDDGNTFEDIILNSETYSKVTIRSRSDVPIQLVELL